MLQLPPRQQLQFTNTLKRQDGSEVGLDWALGAAVMLLHREGGGEATGEGSWWGGRGFMLGGVVFSVAVLLAVGMGVYVVTKEQVQSRVRAATAMKQHIIKGLDG